MDDDLEPESTNLTYTDIFRESLPSFMAMGMSYEEFYEKDMWLTRAYWKAHKQRYKIQNEYLWLQGMYIYEAFSVVEANVNRKKGQKPFKYTDKPYEIFPNEEKHDKTHEQIVEDEKLKARAWMINLVNFYKKG